MYNRNDPRLRQRLNELSQTLESANESAQANIFTFSQQYIRPCFSGVSECLRPCVEQCFPPRDQRGRARSRRGQQGRAELNFDFYDDWDEDDNDALLGWGADERQGLLEGIEGAGSNAGPVYGTNVPRQPLNPGRREPNARRKDHVPRYDDDADTTVIPGPSYFGFFGRLTNVIGGPKKLRYRPSVADLQDHPGARTKLDMLAEETGDPVGTAAQNSRGRRQRSATISSGHTTDSFSSRGDIFPSDDEDDAVPLDDEFAMVLERRTTNSIKDDSASSGRPRRPKKRRSQSSQTSRQSLQTASTVSVREGVSRMPSRQTLEFVSVPSTPIREGPGVEDGANEAHSVHEASCEPEREPPGHTDITPARPPDDESDDHDRKVPRSAP